VTATRPLIDWSKWKSVDRASCLSDSLTSYEQCDQSWHLYWPRVGWVNVYRFGTRYAITACYAHSTWSKRWFDSFDSAALAGVLHVLSTRAHCADWTKRTRLRYGGER
jgi:hypothetical protein